MCSACVRSFLIERNRHNIRSRYKLYYFNAYNTRKLSYPKRLQSRLQHWVHQLDIVPGTNMCNNCIHFVSNSIIQYANLNYLCTLVLPKPFLNAHLRLIYHRNHNNKNRTVLSCNVMWIHVLCLTYFRNYERVAMIYDFVFSPSI